MSPQQQQLTLFFDTETVGSITRMFDRGPHWPPLDEQPFIVQLSFILFDSSTYEMVDFYSAYVRIARLDLINGESFRWNGIRREQCATHGRPILEVLKRFYDAYARASTVIAHNIKFDRKMIIFERKRNQAAIDAAYPEMRLLFHHETDRRKLPVQEYCTMRETTAYCGLENPNTGRAKWPKLIELYRILFREDPPQPLHNAVIDSLVLLRCYLKFAEDKEIHAAKFQRMIKRGFVLANLSPDLLRVNLQSLC